MSKHSLDEYSGSRIFRACGQLGIPYADVIASPYGRVRGWTDGAHEVQYRDGVRGTVGWGDDAQPLRPQDTLSYSRAELLALLRLQS